jgi:hypothetical protein
MNSLVYQIHIFLYPRSGLDVGRITLKIGQICLFIYNARRRSFPCQPIYLKYDPDRPGSLKAVQYT